MKQALAQRLWQAYRGPLAWFAAGVVVGVMFAEWLRNIVTLLFVAGVGLVLYLIWGYKQKKT